MNERIKELIKQCTSWSDGSTWTQREVFDKEKFARLIVREAAQFVSGSSEVYTQLEQDAVVRAAKGLKQYFGVEE